MGEAEPEYVIALEAEIERLRYEQNEMDRAVRLYETAEDLIVWADRPDLFWCQNCDQYHRNGHVCRGKRGRPLRHFHAPDCARWCTGNADCSCGGSGADRLDALISTFRGVTDA